jgi:signal transduction histidine kinase
MYAHTTSFFDKLTLDILIPSFVTLIILIVMFYMWRKKHKIQLKDKEEANYHSIVLNCITAPILVVKLKEERKIVLYNKAAEEFYGMELIQHPTPVIVGKPNPSCKLKIIDPDGTTCYDEQLTFKNKEPMMVRTSRQRITEGENEYMVIVRINVTQHHATTIKAQRNNQLQLDFIRNISHEIRTPLNAIVGFSDLLTNAESIDKRNDYIRIINENCSNLYRLMDDILILAKIESRTMTFVWKELNINDHLNELIQNTISTHTNKELKFAILFPFQKCTLSIDKDFLSIVCSNFISNAIKHTEEGAIKIGYLIENGNFFFFVQDTGNGIAPDRWESVFDRFEKINTFSPGIGLGLSICKQIFLYRTGCIGLYSELGKGSLFWFSLPLADRDVQVEGLLNEDIAQKAHTLLEKRQKGLWFEAQDGHITTKKGYSIDRSFEV